MDIKKFIGKHAGKKIAKMPHVEVENNSLVLLHLPVDRMENYNVESLRNVLKILNEKAKEKKLNIEFVIVPFGTITIIKEDEEMVKISRSEYEELKEKAWYYDDISK